MPVNLRGRNFLKLLDFTSQEIDYLLVLAKNFKDMKRANLPHARLIGKNVVLLFQKTSTRTRCSFEVGAMDLGMGVTNLDAASCQLGTKESLEDTARVISRIYDGIEYRGFDHSEVETLAAASCVPVWNGLTNQWHPTQMLADVLTLREEFGTNLHGRKLVFLGDAKNNVARSLMVVCAKMGINFVAACPLTCAPDAALVQTCTQIAKEHASTIEVCECAQEACKGADAIYTDVWVSLGEPDSVWQARINELLPYKVTSKLMALAKPNAIFMHCLPAFHDTNTTVAKKQKEKFGLSELEVSDEVFRSAKSRVFEQAENRMHTIKAVMYATLA